MFIKGENVVLQNNNNNNNNTNRQIATYCEEPTSYVQIKMYVRFLSVYVAGRLFAVSCYCLLLLGRLPKVDRIILEGENVRPSVRPSARPSVRPQKVSSI